MLHNNRSHHKVSPHTTRSSPARHNQRKPLCINDNPAQPKIKIKKNEVLTNNMDKSQKHDEWKKPDAQEYIVYSESESRSVVSDSLRFHGLHSPWNSLGQNTGMSSPNPGIEPRSPTLQADSLPAESSGKPKGRRLGDKELMLSNCDAREDSWESLGEQDQTSQS